MRTSIAILLTATAMLGQMPRKSPHETINGTVGAAKITVSYGRPYLKGRSLDKLIPEDQIWRAGADEATTLQTDKEIMVGSLAVPAGTYALFFMSHGKTDGELVVNKVAEQWGLDYDKNKGQDLGSTKMKLSSASAPVEQFTMSLSGSKLQMMWGTWVASVALKSK